ncbi:MAG TPA: glycosyltransferase family 39 protein [Thermodesulfobacteriota bacterium]|nr:glycosyltransferase family 39 protein [Thermodesulfobacteriota bacterium]
MSLESTDTKGGQANRSKYWPWIAVAIVIGFVAAIRIRLLQIPLERDEGEFAYMGQLMLQGIPPYLLAYNMKFPGIYAAYALMMAIFGQTIAGIHIGLMVVNAIATLLLFLLTRRLFDDVAGVFAAAYYGLLSLSPSVYGTAAHATQFIVPFALGGTLLLLKSVDSRKYAMLFVSGLLYGLAFMMKQHAVFFIAFALLYFIYSMILRHPLDLKRLAVGTGLLVLASAIPFIVSCATLYGMGVFPRFWFWTFTYASQYVSEFPLSIGIRNFIISALRAVSLWVWATAGLGLTAIVWNDKARAKGIFLIGFSLFSFLSICPGFFFRNHYFVTLFPAVALLAGVAASAMRQFLSDKKMPLVVQILPLLIVAGTVVVPLSIFSRFFFMAAPAEACRMMYGENPFPESIEIGKYIKNHSTKDDKIAVIGSEPQIYFYANRKSATGYIYVYGLMEAQHYASKMQLDMINEIEKARPKYIVFVNIPYSWLARPNSDTTILKWAPRYLDLNYRIVGLVEINPQGHSKAYWDDEAKRNRPASPFNVHVLERKEQ